MNRTTKEDTREKILSAGFEVYAKYGLSGATLTDVAKRAKITPQVLRYHFENEKALVVALCKASVESLSTVSADAIQKTQSKNPDELFASYIQATYDWVEQNPHAFKLWLQMLAETSVDADVMHIFKSSRAAGRQKIEVLIYRGIETKKWLAPSIGVEAAAREIQNLITGQVISWALDPKDSKKKDMQLLIHVAKCLLNQ